MTEITKELLPEEKLELLKEAEWGKGNKQIKEILEKGIEKYIEIQEIDLKEGYKEKKFQTH